MVRHFYTTQEAPFCGDGLPKIKASQCAGSPSEAVKFCGDGFIRRAPALRYLLNSRLYASVKSSKNFAAKRDRQRAATFLQRSVCLRERVGEQMRRPTCHASCMPSRAVEVERHEK